MSWKLDTIDLNNYGVYVSKSAGVLDMPEMVEQSTNWLDLNGKDYWQNVADVKYKDRSIKLFCFMMADSYADFKTNLTAFYNAVYAANKRTLDTPFGNSIEVFMEDEIRVIRKIQYVGSIQAGVFTLTFTVQGDLPLKPIVIYDAVGGVRGTYGYGSDAKQAKALMADNSISFNLEFDTKNVLGREDYILFENEKYVAFEYPKIIKKSSNKFEYKCEFKHQFFALEDIQILVDGNTPPFYWGTMEDILDLIITNANRQYPGLFVKGYVVSTINKNHQFSANDSALSSLKRIVEGYELEYRYSMFDGVITISVAKKVGTASGITLSYGKNNNLYEIDRSSTNRDKIVTHLYGFGATRNLPSTYGFDRLQPTSLPLIKPFYNTKREQTVNWDDIYPERTGTVSSYTYTPSDDPENYPEKAVYALGDSSMPFDLKATDAQGQTLYLFPGTTAKMHFNSGDMAGFELEIKDYDHDTKIFYLTPLKEADSLLYPNETLYPKVGDEYVLLDINLPQSYIDDAIARLDARNQEYIDYYYQPHTQYTLTLKSGYTGVLDVGDTANINDPDFELETLRVIEITRDLYLNTRQLDFSDIVRLSNRQILEKKVNDIEKVITFTRLDDANQQRRNDRSIQEINNKLIDPLDEKFRADQVVRSESIDPRMLAYDAGMPQFILKNALVETNVDNDEDKVVIGSGNLIMLNWRPNTLDRAAIQKLVDGGGTYDPTRTWNVPATTFNLPTADGYFLYAKLDLTAASTVCTLEVDTSFIMPKVEYDGYDAGYIKYPFGYITDKASPRYAMMLWGNQKVPSLSQVNGIVDTKITANNADVIPALVKEQVIAGFKKPYLIENTTAAAIEQQSEWTVLAYNELVGQFKVTATITNKSLETITTLKSLLGYDYTEATIEDDNAIVSDGTITLALSVDGITNKLKANLTGMPTDAKRIYFCFERCILSNRPIDMTVAMNLQAAMNIGVQNLQNVVVAMGMQAAMDAAVDDVGSVSSAITFIVGTSYNSNRFYTSVDSSTWVAQAGNGNEDIYSIEYLNGYWLVGGYMPDGSSNDKDALIIGSDGENWTSLGTFLFDIRGIAYSGGIYVAIGSWNFPNIGYCIAYCSSDPTVPANWNVVSSSIFSTIGRRVHHDGTRFLALGRGTNSMAYSTTGSSWTGLGTSIFSYSGNDIAFDGSGKYIAVGQQNSTHNMAYCNGDPTNISNWNGLGLTIFSTGGYCIAYGNGIWVAGGEGINALAYCTGDPTNISNWNGLGTSVFANRCLDIKYNSSDGYFYAIGNSASDPIMKTNDGVNWSSANPSHIPALPTLNCIGIKN